MDAVALRNPDGKVSPATGILMSHRAFRRDAARFTHALDGFKSGDTGRAQQLREAWSAFEAKLHGHHHAEDERIFPGVRTAHPELAATLDSLSNEHHQLEALIHALTRAFAALPSETGLKETRQVLASLNALLLPHLDKEDRSFIPTMRTEPMVTMELPESEYPLLIEGIAWAAEGVDPAIVKEGFAGMPAPVLAKFDASWAAYTEKYRRIWGSLAPPTGKTAYPDR